MTSAGNGLEAAEQVGQQSWNVRFGKLEFAAEKLPKRERDSLGGIIKGLGGGSVVSVLVATSEGAGEPLMR